MRLLAAALAIFALSACGEEETAAEGSGAAKGPRRGGRGAAAVPVKVEKVVRAEMNAYVETYARLEAERRVEVRSRSTGLVQGIFFEEGDFVRSGQLMVRLEKNELSLRLRQSEAVFEEAQVNYLRSKDLQAKKMVSQTEYEAAQLHYENSKIALEEAQLSLAYADIEAPLSGVVALRTVEMGDLVGSNQSLFTIVDLDPLMLRIFIPERRMYQLRKGQEAKIGIEALPERDFRGAISMISPEVNPQNGTVKVTLEVAADGMLKPGMFATVRIITDSRPQALVIPKKALILETEGDDVYTVVNDTVYRTAVELGFSEGDRVEVVSGLEEGGLVVTVGHDGLKDGTRVRTVGDGLMPKKGGKEGGKKPQAGPGDNLVLGDGKKSPARRDSTRKTAAEQAR